MSRMHLMESFCLTLLCHGCEVLCLSNQQPTEYMLEQCVSVYRKVFKMHQWEAVMELQ